MGKRLIGTADVIDGKAEYIWDMDDNISAGTKKIYLAYLGTDGYMVAESWENITIKIPTSIVLEQESIITNPTVNPEHPVMVTLNAIVSNTKNLEPVPEGKVQFQVKTEMDDIFVNIGNPVPVINGVASYNYNVPRTPQTTIEIRAIYLGNDLYDGAECSNPMIMNIRGTVDLSIKSLRTNQGNTETISATVKTFDGETVESGSLNFYLDNQKIKTISAITSQKVEFEYVFPQNINSGEHQLKVEYMGSDDYSGGYATNIVYIRSKTFIDDSIVYAPPTVVENNEVVQGIATIPINVLDDDGNIVPEGTVEFTCNGTTETVNFGVNTSREISYNIPLGMQGGDEIPFTLSYQENFNYQSCTIQSSIVIKFRTTVELDDFEGNQGDTVTLRAFVTDENGQDVDEGEVEFGMETNSDDV